MVLAETKPESTIAHRAWKNITHFDIDLEQRAPEHINYEPGVNRYEDRSFASYL